MSINTEDLVSSLLYIGYPKVDSDLFISARSILASTEKFKFVDFSISKVFNSPIEFNGLFFKLKEELSPRSSLGVALNRNAELTDYLISEGFGVQKVQVADKPKTKALVMKI